MDCIFCKIVKGEIPCQKIYEDEDFLAFLDIRPINKGHALLIPKEHHENLLDMPDELKVTPVLKKVARAVYEAMGASAFNIGMNNFSDAGQVVLHSHWHIIPRYPEDGLQHWPGHDVSSEELEEVQKRIKEKL